MKREEFLRNLHLLMDKYEDGKGASIWKLDGTNLLDDFYSYCEWYGKKQDALLVNDEMKK